ncbi:MAG: SphA family protein [Candidatus Deferrimicrobiaceae bacterium]
MMKRVSVFLLVAFVLIGLCGSPAQAFNEPPLNLGLTDILDGGIPGVGTFFTEYVQVYQSDEFKDSNGDDIPGLPRVSSVLSVNQLVHVYKQKLLGAHIGVNVLLPVVSINGGGLPTNPGVLGDLLAGPFLQWLDTKLLGRPFVQRLELDITMPTGQYDKKYALNPGSNLWVIEPFYAFTWFLTPKFSTSWRIHYTVPTKNDDVSPSPFNDFSTEVTPGQVFHFNYSFEYEFFKGFRGAVAGYYLKQLTEDEGSFGDISNSEEQVFAVGPALHYFFSDKFSAGLKTQWETSTENRTEGNRTTLRFTYLF